MAYVVVLRMLNRWVLSLSLRILVGSLVETTQVSSKLRCWNAHNFIYSFPVCAALVYENRQEGSAAKGPQAP